MIAWGTGVQRGTIRGHKETFEGDVNVYLDCGDGFIGLYICQN